MTNFHLKALLFLALLMSSFHAGLQAQFTPCDDLPGMVKSCKPSYSSDMPSWARMLYSWPVNYKQVCREFDAWESAHPGEKNAATRYFRIWQKAVEPYVMEDGSIDLPDMEQVYRSLREVQQGAGKGKAGKPEANSDWSFLGPKETFWLNESGSPNAPGPCPWQVNVYSFDVAASDNNVIYCGTETGYVNKTTDKGLHWTLTAPGYFFGGSVTAVAIHPSNPDLVYVSAGNQVHKSTDGGINWQSLLPGGGQFYADRLKMDPSGPQKIIAASATGLFITSDAGATWTQKWTAPVYDAEFKPNDNSQVFALTKSAGKFSVIQSADGGNTFQVMTSFPNSITESSGGLLAMSPANPDMMLAILLSANNTPYLLKGINSSGNWIWSVAATGQTGSFPMNNGQGYFDLVLDISPLNQNIILVGTTTLYKSINGGNTFTSVGGYAGSYNIHPDIQDIKMLPSGETWVSTDGGMNLTTDNFSSQGNYSVRINGIAGSDMWGFDQGWNEDLVVGGRYHNGNTAMADFYEPKALRMGGAESPTGWVMQGKSRHAAFNDLGNGWILPLTATGKPQGRFIFSKYPNMDEYGGRRGNLAFHPNYYGTVYLGEGNSFWRSRDMGVTWDLLYTFSGRVRYLQISYSDPSVIYADVVNQGLFRSGDGGLTWVQKPTLTSPPYGNSNWKGKLFFAISPYDADVIYACLQNGTWSADLGKVFRSADGGNTWTEWTGTVNEYLKCLVVQPTASGQDLVYLFTNAKNGHASKVFYRKESMPDWVSFGTNYPAGFAVNLALPFFRDGKIRVAGNAGVWESPLEEEEFTPIVSPWIEKQHYSCMTDTLYFDDHSMLNHAGASWHWDINPAPSYLESADIRNPKVVLGSLGSYDVSLTVTKNGQTFTKSIPGMVTTTSCPSIYDCNNPAELPKDIWSLIYFDSEEVNDPGYAWMCFDNNPNTIWHTCWSTANPPYPHEIQIALGQKYKVSKFTYLTRQDSENGRIKDFELYLSNDSLNWGPLVKSGSFINTGAPQTIVLDSAVSCSFFRLVALNEVNGNPWASAAEFSFTGCVDYPVGTGVLGDLKELRAFPVPSCGYLTIEMPVDEYCSYDILDPSGRITRSGTSESDNRIHRFSLDGFSAGTYIIILRSSNGEIFRVRTLKK